MDLAERSRVAQASLEDFFENGALGLHIVGADGTILLANKAELELLGYGADEYIGRHIADFHADQETISDILARLGKGEVLDQYPARLRAKSGDIKHVLISSSVYFDESGGFLSTRCFTVDVTQRLKGEEELRQAQQRLSATYEHALVGISEVDHKGRYLRTNEGLTRITGHGKDELVGRTVFSITHPEDAVSDAAMHARQVRGELDRYMIEKRYIRADGQIIWVHVLSSTVKAADGSFLYSVRVAHDITDRKRSEDRYQLLINELNHRVKNTLTTVQSFASQTARTSHDIDEFVLKFEGRLMALSQAQDCLTRRNWESASLAELVAAELALHGGEGRACTAHGPDVSLLPQPALALSMALHELGTNAVKYGAISVPGGHLRLEWNVARDDHARPVALDFRWIEEGGPPVTPPATRSFGSRLLDAVTVELAGESQLLFDPAGVKWLISFPLQPAPSEIGKDVAAAAVGPTVV